MQLFGFKLGALPRSRKSGLFLIDFVTIVFLQAFFKALFEAVCYI